MILIPALPSFRELYPKLHIDLGVSDRPIDLIGEGVDCVIRGGELADTSLVARRLADLDWVTCASPSYLAVHGVPIHPSGLMHPEPAAKDKMCGRGHAILGYFSSLTGRPFPLEFCKAADQILVQGQVVVGVNDSSAYLSALLSGVGLGQAFRFMVAPHLESGKLRTVLDDWNRPRHRLSVVYPSNRHLSAKTRLFVEWVAHVFAPFDDR